MAADKIKEWILSIKSGDVNNILEDIGDEFCDEKAHELFWKLFIELASEISRKQSKYAGNPSDVYTLASKCCNFIKNGSINDELKFLRCLHFLIKFLIEKGEVELGYNTSSYTFLLQQDHIFNNDGLLQTCYATNCVLRAALTEDIVKQYKTPVILQWSLQNSQILMYCGPRYISVLLDAATVVDRLTEKSCHGEFLNEKIDYLTKVLKMSTECMESMDCVPFPVLQKYLQIVLLILRKDALKNHPSFRSDVIELMQKVAHHTKLETSSSLCFSLLCELLAYAFPSNNSCEALKQYVFELSTQNTEQCYKLVNYTNKLIPFVCSKLYPVWSNWSSEEWNYTWTVSSLDQFFKWMLNFQDAVNRRAFSTGGLNNNEEDTSLSLVRLHITIGILVCYMTCHSIESKMEHFDKLLPSTVAAFQASSKFLQQFNHLYKDCTDCWQKIGTYFSNIGVKLINKGEYQHSKTIYSAFFKACQELGPPFQGALLQSGCCYIDSLVMLNEFKDAQKVCAVCIVMFPDDQNQFFKKFVRVKQHSCDAEIQACSLFNILMENFEGLESEFRGISLNNCNMNEILVAELEAYDSYGAVWQSFESAGLALSALLPQNVLSAVGIESYLLAAWKFADKTGLERALSVAKETISLLSKNERNSAQLQKIKLLGLIGNMHYLSYILKLKILQKIQKETVETSKPQVEEESLESKGEARDTTTLFVSEYVCLEIEKEAELVAVLHKAVTYWARLLEHKKYFCTELESFFKRVLDYVETASHMYGITGCFAHQFYALCVYYNICDRMGWICGKITAISNMLRFCYVDIPQEWLVECEDLVHSLETESVDGSNDLVICFYFISKGWYCLHRNQVGESYQHTCEVKNRLKDSSEWELLQCETNFLHSIFLGMPKFKVQSEEKGDSISNGLAVYNGISQYLKKKRNNIKLHSKAMCILMDVAQWLTDIHLSLYWISDIYAILRELLVLTQIGAFPTRMANILVSMVESDILRTSFEEAKPKLLSLEKILDSTKLLCRSGHENKSSIIAIDDLSEQLSNMTLTSFSLRIDDEIRNDITKTFKTSENASPICVSRCAKSHSLQLHASSCSCYFCENVLIHCILIHYTYAKANYSHLSDNSSLSLGLYETGLNFCISLYKMQSVVLHRLGKLASNLINCNTSYNKLQNMLLKKIQIFALYYANFFSKYKKHKQADILIQWAVEIRNIAQDFINYSMVDLTELQYALKILFLGANMDVDPTVYKNYHGNPSVCFTNSATPVNVSTAMFKTPVMTGKFFKASSEFHKNMIRNRRVPKVIDFDIAKDDDQCNIDSTKKLYKENNFELANVVSILISDDENSHVSNCLPKSDLQLNESSENDSPVKNICLSGKNIKTRSKTSKLKHESGNLLVTSGMSKTKKSTTLDKAERRLDELINGDHNSSEDMVEDDPVIVTSGKEHSQRLKSANHKNVSSLRKNCRSRKIPLLLSEKSPKISVCKQRKQTSRIRNISSDLAGETVSEFVCKTPAKLDFPLNDRKTNITRTIPHSKNRVIGIFSDSEEESTDEVHKKITQTTKREKRGKTVSCRNNETDALFSDSTDTKNIKKYNAKHNSTGSVRTLSTSNQNQNSRQTSKRML